MTGADSTGRCVLDRSITVPKPESQLDRREFLQRSVVGAVGVGMLGVPGAGAAEESGVRQYKKLGSTGLEISEVLRTRMYATDYGDVEMARASYASLGDGASACQTCADQPCANACPVGLPIASMTKSMPRILRG